MISIYHNKIKFNILMTKKFYNQQNDIYDYQTERYKLVSEWIIIFIKKHLQECICPAVWLYRINVYDIYFFLDISLTKWQKTKALLWMWRSPSVSPWMTRISVFLLRKASIFYRRKKSQCVINGHWSTSKVCLSKRTILRARKDNSLDKSGRLRKIA